MISRFDPDFNAEIRRVVSNFNRKRNRGIKRGYKYLPNKVYVSDIKEQFQTPGEIERYLKQLEAFNVMGDSAYQEVTTLGGAKTSLYQMNFIRDNLEETKEFYDRQIAEARRIFEADQYSMGKREYLFNLEEKRKDLELDINTLTPSQFKSFERYTNAMLDENRSKINAYRGFLSVVEQTMKLTGIPRETRNKFFDKMSNLSPSEFVKMYRDSGLVGRVYELIVSPKEGPAFVNTSDEDAELLINELIENFDNIKEEALKK